MATRFTSQHPSSAPNAGTTGAICRVAAGTTTALSDGGRLSHQHLEQQHRGSDGRDYRATLARMRCCPPARPKSALSFELTFECCTCNTQMLTALLFESF